MRWVDGLGHALRSREPLAAERADLRRRLGVEPGPGEPDVVTATAPDGTRVPLEMVPKFTYLGRVLSADNSETACITARIQAATASANALFGRNRLKHASQAARVAVFNMVSRAQLCYAGQTWCMTQACRHRIDTFHLRWLRRLTGLTPRMKDGHLTHHRNVDVYKAAGVTRKLSDELDVHRLRFFGHTLRRPSAIINDIDLIGMVGQRDSTTLRAQLVALAAEAGLPAGNLTTLRAAAQDRPTWMERVESLRESRHDAGTGD